MLSGELVLDGLKCRADPVSQLRKPGLGPGTADGIRGKGD
jgi:hypothetical protein